MAIPPRLVYRFASGMRYARRMSLSILRATFVPFAASTLPPAALCASAPNDAVASTAAHLKASVPERRFAPVQGLAENCTGFASAYGRLPS